MSGTQPLVSNQSLMVFSEKFGHLQNFSHASVHNSCNKVCDCELMTQSLSTNVKQVLLPIRLGSVTRPFTTIYNNKKDTIRKYSNIYIVFPGASQQIHPKAQTLQYSELHLRLYRPQLKRAQQHDSGLQSCI